MGIRRSKHAVYDLKYHLIWVPKYRKHILGGEVATYLKEVFTKIAEEYGFSIDTMEVTVERYRVEDHVHLFAKAPPGCSPSEMVQVMKSISAREVFKKFPMLKKQLWAGELWNDGYTVAFYRFARSVGDKITADIIRRYIEYQNHEDNSTQLNMFGSP